MLAKKIFIACVLLCAAFAAFMLTHRGSAERAAFFAYGTDLGASTMKARAGGFAGAAAARATGYSLSFQSGANSEFGVANLVPDALGSTPGAVYWLSQPQMDALDSAEGVPGFYARQYIEATLANGSAVEAVAHVLPGEPPLGSPIQADRAGDKRWPFAVRLRGGGAGCTRLGGFPGRRPELILEGRTQGRAAFPENLRNAASPRTRPCRKEGPRKAG